MQMGAAKHCQKHMFACICKAGYSFPFQFLLTTWTETEQSPLCKEFSSIHFMSFLLRRLLFFLKFWPLDWPLPLKNISMASVSPMDFKHLTCRRLFLSSDYILSLFSKRRTHKQVFTLHFFQIVWQIGLLLVPERLLNLPSWMISLQFISMNEISKETWDFSVTETSRERSASEENLLEPLVSHLNCWKQTADRHQENEVAGERDLTQTKRVRGIWCYMDFCLFHCALFILSILRWILSLCVFSLSFWALPLRN